MERRHWFFVVAGAIALVLLGLALAKPFNDDLDVERPLALEGAGPDAVTFELEEVNRSSQFGFVTLDPVSESKTRIGLELGAPIGLRQPAHLHTGSCGSVSPRVAHGLEPLMQKNPRLATSRTTIDIGLVELQRAGFVVDVHQSDRDAERVACGEVPR